jgi:hypothetical protein
VERTALPRSCPPVRCSPIFLSALFSLSHSLAFADAGRRSARSRQLFFVVCRFLRCFTLSPYLTFVVAVSGCTVAFSLSLSIACSRCLPHPFLGLSLGFIVEVFVLWSNECLPPFSFLHLFFSFLLLWFSYFFFFKGKLVGWEREPLCEC